MHTFCVIKLLQSGMTSHESCLYHEDDNSVFYDMIQMCKVCRVYHLFSFISYCIIDIGGKHRDEHC